MRTARSQSRIPSSAWLQPLQQVEAAIARGEDPTTVAAWRHAYGAAIRSSQWEGLMEVGAAAHRLADGHENARQAYRTALFRAQREGSLDGLLRAAIAFGDLGDRDVLIRPCASPNGRRGTILPSAPACATYPTS